MRKATQLQQPTTRQWTKPIVEARSGNVFADLELPNADMELVKAMLVRRISKVIKEHNLTEAQAADILDTDQQKLSALTRGRFSGYSMEWLFRFLNALGHDVEIVVRASQKAHGKPTTRVVTLQV
jgi:predicted XRE-type DNA-binding protein